MCALIAGFVWPTWGPSGADRTQVGPMLALWTLLSGFVDRFLLGTIPLMPFAKYSYHKITNFNIFGVAVPCAITMVDCFCDFIWFRTTQRFIPICFATRKHMAFPVLPLSLKRSQFEEPDFCCHWHPLRPWRCNCAHICTTIAFSCIPQLWYQNGT